MYFNVYIHVVLPIITIRYTLPAAFVYFCCTFSFMFTWSSSPNAMTNTYRRSVWSCNPLITGHHHHLFAHNGTQSERITKPQRSSAVTEATLTSTQINLALSTV